MIPNITQGNDPHGLMRYLFGSGKRNEHEDPHLVAAHEGLTIDVDRPDPTRAQIRALGYELADVADTFNAVVPAGHVWHCSVSLPREDGKLSDDQWARIAHRVVDHMGFSPAPGPDGDLLAGRAGCRWLAVRHGLSAGGNDHIHIALSLVREDGTIANDWRSYKRVQAVCRELEDELGLTIVAGRRRDHGRAGHLPAASRADREITARTDGPDEPPLRERLEHHVRAAAAASANEAEFVTRLREAGLLLRPRRGRGRDGQTTVTGYSVTGYSVAEDPARGGRTAPHRDTGQPGPIWFGGGKLAADLTLPKLRATWTPADHAPAHGRTARRDAVAAWLLAGQTRQSGPAGAARPTSTPLSALHHIAAHIGAAGAGSGGADAGPEFIAVTIADVAAPLSRLVAVAAIYDTTPGRPLLVAERHLARLAQTRRPPAAGAAEAVYQVADAMLGVLSIGADEETRAMLRMLREIEKLCDAIVDAINAGKAPAYDLRAATTAAEHVTEARQHAEHPPPGHAAPRAPMDLLRFMHAESTNRPPNLTPTQPEHGHEPPGTALTTAHLHRPETDRGRSR